MDLFLFLSIIRRYWPVVVAVPLLVALLSLAAALARPPAYAASTRLLVTRADFPESRAGLSAGGNEDTVAYDLPVVVSGALFRRDLAAALAEQGRPIGEDALVTALSATNQKSLVTLTATAGQPEDAVAIVQTAVELIRTNGLRYWNEPRATPERPGLNVASLDAAPPVAARLDGPRTVVIEVALRTIIGAVAGVGLALLLRFLAEGWRIAVERRQGDQETGRQRD
jgi:capsular polysaccharide biosynthesis protein